MSGFEVVGVIFGVLPFLIEAGKQYSKSPLRKAIPHPPYDEELCDFYTSFYWEASELKSHITTLFQHLPNLSEETKAEILQKEGPSDWNKDPQVARSFSELLISIDDKHDFDIVMKKVLKLLDKLIDDESLKMTRADMGQTAMFLKLQKLQQDIDSGETKSRLWARIRFWKKASDRDTCLQNLNTWNKRLGKVVDRACNNAARNISVSAAQKDLHTPLRLMSMGLFTALAHRWACSCGTRHEACFSLRSPEGFDFNANEGVAFNFLVFHSSHPSERYCEGAIAIKRTSAGLKKRLEGVELSTICDVTQPKAGRKFCLNLLVEYEDATTTLATWRLRSNEPILRYRIAVPSMSFADLLERYPNPPLASRRRLALVFARSLLQLHENPWLSDQWDKGRMRFFYKDDNDIDLLRPFISTPFEQFPPGSEPVDLDRFHRNPGLLRLGILLIEVNCWAPLEKFYTADDLDGGEPTPNTELLVARRVQRTMDGCVATYMGAVTSCLDVPWVPSGERVSLGDAETRSGMYTHIVKPLEDEVAACPSEPTLSGGLPSLRVQAPYCPS